jgi:hypothetical protein
MGTLIALVVLAFTVAFIIGTLALVGFIIKAVFWIVFFPIRLLFKMVFWTIGAGLAALMLPIVLVVAAVAVIGSILAAVFALLAPLLPVALVALVGWAIYRGSTRRPSPVI